VNRTVPSIRNLRRSDDWAEASGSLRGSSILAAGALLAAVATLTNLAAELVTLDEGSARTVLLMAAWLSWILAMATTGLGFVIIGTGPVLSRLGIPVGSFHLIYAGLLLVTIFTQLNHVIPLSAIGIGRCILLVAFALGERSWLSQDTVALLSAAASLQALKIALRVVGVLPELEVPMMPVIDAVAGVVLSLVLFHTAFAIRRIEADWAADMANERVTGLETFNNPDHDDLLTR